MYDCTYRTNLPGPTKPKIRLKKKTYIGIQNDPGKSLILKKKKKIILHLYRRVNKTVIVSLNYDFT